MTRRIVGALFLAALAVIAADAAFVLAVESGREAGR